MTQFLAEVRSKKFKQYRLGVFKISGGFKNDLIVLLGPEASAVSAAQTHN